MNVVIPLLLELYGDHEIGLLSRDELLEALRLLEAYVFRRAVCAIPSNSQQKTFATFSRALRREPDHYLPSFKAHLLNLPSYRRFPSDEEFRRDLQIRNLYKFNKSCSYWLRRLDNHERRKELIAVAEYTIEHILPQNPELPFAWREALGTNWRQVQEEWLHRLGNLTLTGYNPELGDRPFLEKRDGKGGFGKSPLHLNEGLGQLERWDVDAMRQRGERLADRALVVWGAPQLSEEQRQAYRPIRSRTKASLYTLDDHPYLGNPTIRALFDALDAAIRSLDPNVSQEVLKLYIAYKAETNFVDIDPQAKRLRLSLNRPFGELDDPKRRAKNVTGISRKGNGDVELGVATLEDVPYALGLIRQSLERQLEEES